MQSRQTPIMLMAMAALAAASLLLLPVERLLATGAATPALPVPLLRLLTMVQPALLLALALWLGQRFAPRLGLGTPLLDAVATGTPLLVRLRPRLPAIIAVAVLCAALLTLWGWLVVPLLFGDSAMVQFETPLLTRLLYGGIGEEILLRWGLLSALAAAGLRLGLQRGGALAVAALLSSLLFGAGHLPLLALMAPGAPGWGAAAVVVANALPGLLFAGLFIRHGLEAAMLAHAGAHLLAMLLAQGAAG